MGSPLCEQKGLHLGDGTDWVHVAYGCWTFGYLSASVGSATVRHVRVLGVGAAVATDAMFLP